MNTTSIACPQCSAEMPADAAFCPGCGRRMIVAPAAVADTGPVPANVAAAVAYVAVVPAIVFLALPSFKHNRLVRFHSRQSIFLAIAIAVIGLVLRVLFAILTVIPRLGYLLGSLAVLIAALGCATVWVVTVIKAWQGEMFKLPVIGDFAERA
ncbi:MAG TPA: zinc-ribbon domain-containing protein [Terriglobales bacterium]|nr:zinc-ribbon domain-containing protein [Terriglobales bacterium]